MSFVTIANTVGTGYKVTAFSQDLSRDEVKYIRDHSVPKGTGWDSYIGAESLKAFPLPDASRMAVSIAKVTSAKDEAGRHGLLSIEVEIYTREKYWQFLDDYYRTLLRQYRFESHTLQEIPARAIPKKKQLVLAYPFSRNSHLSEWKYVEAVILKAVLMKPLATSFTTFALSAYRESQVVVLPLASAVTKYRNVLVIKAKAQ